MADGSSVDKAAAKRRQANEAKMWLSPRFKALSGGCTADLPDPENILKVIVHIPGPETYLVGGSERPCPFKGHTFRAQVTLSETYPFKCPDAEFLDVPYHPNIKATGEICLDDLNKSWKPTKNLADVAKTLVEFLRQPNADHAVDSAIGSEMSKDLAMFEGKAASLGGRAPAAKTDDD